MQRQALYRSVRGIDIMTFNSYEYIVYLIVVVSSYWLLATKRIQNVLLLAASYFFYANWDARFLSLVIISTVVDYFVGLRMATAERERTRRVLLLISVAVNLGILGYFKYFNFFVESMVDLLTGLGIQTNLDTLNIILPIGISFYTFQTLSYTIDIFRRKMEPTSNFLDFALFVSFFPQLVAGPIERATALLPQLQSERRFRLKQFEEGLVLILLGLFKKLAIADVAATLIEPDAFTHANGVNSLIVMQALYLFGIQIYMDFSAYSDIARGSAKIIGIELMENFNQPYFARNLSEYWRNWHISLTTWLRDYLYIPLRKVFDPIVGKNFNSYAIAVMITMFLSGLWHGAGYTFVIWGLYLGFLQVVQRFIEIRFIKKDDKKRRWRTAISIFVTFHFVTFGWAFFRTPSIGFIPDMFEALMQAPDWSLLYTYWPVLALFTVMLALDFAQRHWRDHAFTLHMSYPVRIATYLLMLLAINYFTVKPYVEFIYFQF